MLKFIYGLAFAVLIFSPIAKFRFINFPKVLNNIFRIDSIILLTIVFIFIGIIIGELSKITSIQIAIICGIYLSYLILNQNENKYYILLIYFLIGYVSSLSNMKFILYPVILIAMYSLRQLSGDRFNNFCVLFSGLVISTLIPYWLIYNGIFNISLINSIKFTLLSLIMIFLINYNGHNKYKINYYLFIFLYTAMVVIYVLSQPASNFLDSFHQWHHWSAYIGQARLMSMGAIPYVDFPLQYGFGPIFLTSLGCNVNCWESFYWLSSATTIGLTLLIVFIAIKIEKPGNILNLIAIGVVFFISCLIYTSHQVNHIFPSITFPSTFGLRFLPGAIFLSILIHDPLSSKYGPINFIYFFVCNIILGLCYVWSPEALVQTSAIWFSYSILILLRTPNKFDRIKLFSAFFLGIVVIITIIIYTYYNVYGFSLNIRNYLTYFIYPPVEKSNFLLEGPILFAIFLYIIFLIVYLRARNKFCIAPLLVSVWCFSNFSYFIGHPDNVVISVLMPYIALFIISIRSISNSILLKKFLALLLATIVGWSTLFYGWDEVFRTPVFSNLINALSSKDSFSKNFERGAQYPFIKGSSFSDEYNTIQERIKQLNLSYALDFIDNKYGEPVETIDSLWLIDAGNIYVPWSAYHGPINYAGLPSSIRSKFLLNFANHFSSPGWLVYDPNYRNVDGFLKDYDAVYNRDLLIDFGAYKAIRYIPK